MTTAKERLDAARTKDPFAFKSKRLGERIAPSTSQLTQPAPQPTQPLSAKQRLDMQRQSDNPRGSADEAAREASLVQHQFSQLQTRLTDLQRQRDTFKRKLWGEYGGTPGFYAQQKIATELAPINGEIDKVCEQIQNFGRSSTAVEGESDG